nr:GMC family oxidoreductase N-terminal domain-containing protein [uncultured Cupriavidus sp.]
MYFVPAPGKQETEVTVRETQASHSAAATFDYIVVGAGSAGCAVASRLADDAATSVLLLEAGPSDHHFSVWTPVAVAAIVPKAGPRNYAYQSVPQPGLDGRCSYQPRGRGLGGSSSINGMVYIRGHRHDYDRWAQLGCQGWGHEDVLPYFRRSETNHAHDDEHHGNQGPLHVNELRSPNPFSSRFITAALQAGIPFNRDFNGQQQDGAGFYQVTQRDGERWNSARAYLHRGDAADQTFSGGRRNLTVWPETQALRIVFEGKRAVGIEVVRSGVKQTLHARREIIVSGGAFNSPQLLLASGIGPAAHLSTFGIDVVHDLPGVGENLQDHLDIAVCRQVDSHDLYGYSLRGAAKILGEVRRYRRDRTGMISSNLAEAGAFVRSRAELDEPDLQFHFVPGLSPTHTGMRRRDLKHGFTGLACVLRPESRGHVRLRSADMRDAPLIDPRFLSAEADMAGMVACFRTMRRIFAQPALASARGRELLTEQIGPGEGDEAAIRAYVRRHADSVFHPVGTCKMGIDAMAVVDPALRVHGIQGLRIADASIMPTLIGGNTNAPAMMIGEKAADLIRAGA